MVRLALCGLVLATLFLGHAIAHDATWIGRKGIYNKQGYLCCGPGDCGHLIAGTVELKPDGWHVDATFQVDEYNDSAGYYPPRPGFTFEVHHIFPETQTLPSQDEETWACQVPGEKMTQPDGSKEPYTRCLFIHPPGV